MIRVQKILFSAVVFCFPLSGSLPFSQASDSGGNIKGTLIDPSGNVIQQATVTLQNTLTGYPQTKRGESL